MSQTILIVDDEATQRNILKHVVIEKLGYHAIAVGCAEEAIEWVASRKLPAPDLILLDYALGDKNAIDVLSHMAVKDALLPVIVVTAFGDTEKAAQCIKAGAIDFLAKPLQVERLEVSMRNALHSVSLRKQVQHLERTRNGRVQFSDIVGGSAALKQAITIGQKASQSMASLLIEGEKGTGKEWFSRAVHGAGSRSRMPFVTANLAGLSDQEVESLLFGHDKGRTVISVADPKGKFVEAEGGTLFLDGVNSLKLETQSKLLRVLQNGEYFPSGSDCPVKINVRVIATSHTPLDKLVQRGEFRGDLFYRLSGMSIRLPALRDRREDIQPLVGHFIAKYAARENRPVMGITNAAMGYLVSNIWPGNIRQLESVVSRAIILSDDTQLDISDFHFVGRTPNAQTVKQELFMDPAQIGHNGFGMEPQTLPKALRDASAVISLVDPNGKMKRMDQLEVETIRFALQYYGGHMSEVARKLGIGRSTLYRKMHDFNIQQPALA